MLGWAVWQSQQHVLHVVREPCDVPDVVYVGIDCVGTWGDSRGWLESAGPGFAAAYMG